MKNFRIQLCIKSIKLILVSSTFEIIIQTVYFVSFFIISLLFISNFQYLKPYDLGNILKYNFNKNDQFKLIKNKADFFQFLQHIVNQLYLYDPNNLKYYIPFGSIRLKKISNKYCFNNIDNRVCSNSECTYYYLQKLFQGNLHCTQNNEKTVIQYSNFAKIFQGDYFKYDFLKDGENFDFIIDDYSSSTKLTEIQNFVNNDNEIKFLGILFNVYFPLEEYYGSVIYGLEMTSSKGANFYDINYKENFSILKNFFDSPFLFVFFNLIFLVDCSLFGIKIIYEMNVKLDFQIILLDSLN